MFNFELFSNEIASKLSCQGCSNVGKVSMNEDSSRTCTLIEKYVEKVGAKVKNMEIYEDDIWIVTFPKSGTTWTQEMVWLINNDLDYKTAREVNLSDRFPFLESHGTLNNYEKDSVGRCVNLQRPRHIKSHLPIFLLPDKLWTVKPKIIYVARNPKDVAVSFYYHYQRLYGYKGTKKDFFEAFLQDLVIYTPYKDHLLDFWKIRDEPNILYLFYEDMKINLDQEVKKTANFLGKNITQQQINEICEHLSFDSMRVNPSCNKDHVATKMKTFAESGNILEDFKFIRKGKVGSFRDEFSEEVDVKFNELMKSLEKDQFIFKI